MRSRNSVGREARLAERQNKANGKNAAISIHDRAEPILRDVPCGPPQDPGGAKTREIESKRTPPRGEERRAATRLEPRAAGPIGSQAPRTRRIDSSMRGNGTP